MEQSKEWEKLQEQLAVSGQSLPSDSINHETINSGGSSGGTTPPANAGGGESTQKD